MPDEIVLDRTVLSQVSRETTIEEIESLDLVNRLRAANKTAWTKGSGLAAIQIGVPVRFAWYIDPQGKERTLINPVIIKSYGVEVAKEGCLSIPHEWIPVSRALCIEYTSSGKLKRARGFEARLIQHEIDHMDGKLIK